MLRGRIVAANGVAAEDLKPAPDATWVLQSDRGITYGDELPAGSRVVAGRMVDSRTTKDRRWSRSRSASPTGSASSSATPSPSTCSAATSPRRSPICARSTGRASASTSSWCSRPPPSGARRTPTSPPSPIPAAARPDEEIALLKAVADAFPAVTAVRVRDALDAVGQIVTNLMLGVRGASALTLVVAVLVLGGALAAGHRHRVYDAVILKTVGRDAACGCSRAYALEYLAARRAPPRCSASRPDRPPPPSILTRVMNLSFGWLPGPACWRPPPAPSRRPWCWG